MNYCKSVCVCRVCKNCPINVKKQKSLKLSIEIWFIISNITLLAISILYVVYLYLKMIYRF